MAFAEASLKLGAPQKDGRSLQWHLQVIYEKTGVKPKELDTPPIPFELVHVWEYFIQLNRKRTNGGMAANPLSDADILAWQARHGIRLTPFESECIDDLDFVFLDRRQ